MLSSLGLESRPAAQWPTAPDGPRPTAHGGPVAQS